MFKKYSEVYAEVFGDVLNDDRGEHPGTGDHAELQEVFLDGLAPFVERVEAHAGLISQLLFGHCFHLKTE